MNQYFGVWTKQTDLEMSFSTPSVWDLKIVVAGYFEMGYEGDAYVLGIDDNGKLFEVEASHCSCYDLQGTWKPMEVTVEYLEQRLQKGSFLTSEIADAVRLFVKGNQ